MNGDHHPSNVFKEQEIPPQKLTETPDQNETTKDLIAGGFGAKSQAEKIQDLSSTHHKSLDDDQNEDIIIQIDAIDDDMI